MLANETIAYAWGVGLAADGRLGVWLQGLNADLWGETPADRVVETGSEYDTVLAEIRLSETDRFGAWPTVERLLSLRPA